MSEIRVVGCGIVGLASAIELQELGHRVRIVARELPPSTTSNKAAAIWEPYRAEPAERVAEWSARSYRRYRSQYADPASGVEKVELIEVARKRLADPFWLRPEYPFRRLAAAELPAGYGDGYAVEVPFIHSRIYLENLMSRFRDGGGHIEQRALGSLAEVAPGADLIVNASGLGARELVADPEVFPIRGQLAIVEPRHPVRYLVDDDSHPEPVYVFRREGLAILGGTAQAHDGNPLPDEATSRLILERARALEPALEGARFVESIVGLRPGRGVVRLEREMPPHLPPIVHNYGHGGAGFTTAWGCAEEVARLAAAVLSERSGGKA